MIIWQWRKLFKAILLGCTDERVAKYQTARVLRIKLRSKT